MAYLTPVTAKDELYGFINDRFITWLQQNDEVCTLRWQGKLKVAETEPLYVHFSMQQVLSPLKAFVRTDDRADVKMYETSGLIFGQVNVAMAEADGFRRGDLIATALRDMLRDAETPSGIWLRNSRFNELPNDVQYFKWNVIAEYEYDEANT